MRLKQLGEFGLIARLKETASSRRDVIQGIGDDTAVLPLNSQKYLLLTTDMIVEDVHFTRSAPPQAVGHKALACNISDLAAMGGLPTYAVVSIGLPSDLTLSYVENLYRGINRLAKEFNVGIVGGDTVRSSKITINIALLGQVEKKYLTLRSGARAGDWIFVTGSLGRSLPTKKHLMFTPRLKESRFLVERFKPSAMMDISDGLSGDLNHILKASRVGACLYEDQIPRSGAGTKRAASIHEALYDGEDFELLFTLSPAKARRLINWQLKNKRWFFYSVGKITPIPNRLEMKRRDGSTLQLKKEGYQHFKK